MANHIVYFIHILGAISMGFYLFLPFMVTKMTALPKPSQAGYVRALYHVNKVSLYIIILQLLTGGYLISVANVPATWSVVVILLLVVVGGLISMAGAKMKRIIHELEEGRDAKAEAGKVRTFAYLTFIALLLMVLFMVFPHLL
ncbi:hypothetical protein [Alicyclobacillus fastidiosus]|uniref:DUF2269 family protein n=1 Tax=Alicyclobacillus fastidiosus TaxID=392011 RepID=A0ABV5AJM0_9BACL|nr:hypothetical protein [Alicyclobacillus fastidiosus]WEH08283.1 hypothetical protein PYS47_16470 [Alicyclobacillus fastidiosus]